jgi:hypothetical protein
MFPLVPQDWLNFAELVAPELQRRGLTRKEYADGTLRERLGLPSRRIASLACASARLESLHECAQSVVDVVSFWDATLFWDAALPGLRSVLAQLTAIS